MSSSAVFQRIDALAGQGLHEAVITLARETIAAGDAGMALRFRLAAAQLKAGRYRDALETTLAAAGLAPSEPGELVELAKRLLYFNQAGVLREVAARLLARPLWHAAAEADLAALLSMAGDQEQASRLLDRAMGVAGSDAARLYNRSQMHLYSGRMQASEDDLQQCLRLQPDMAKAHWALSKLMHGKATSPQLASMRALAARLPLGSQDEVFMRYALFNRLDRENLTAAAWDELSRASTAKRRLVNYDAAATAQLFDAIMAAFPGSGANGDGARGHAQGSATPIFIVGMHRSGTTLLERMLGNHSQVREGGELYEFPAQLRWADGRHFAGPTDIGAVRHAAHLDYAEIGRRYLAQVAWRAEGKDFLVDKLPSNFLNIGFIQRALPQARVIHMQRDPMDTCWSNLKELFSNACAYSYDQVELADYYARYAQLMRHWRQSLPGFVLDVSYEALARDPEAQARRILAFCGLDFEPGCIDVGSNTRTVNTASSAQVREPIHQRSIQAWRRYETQLAPLAARLAVHGLAPPPPPNPG